MSVQSEIYKLYNWNSIALVKKKIEISTDEQTNKRDKTTADNTDIWKLAN